MKSKFHLAQGASQALAEAARILEDAIITPANYEALSHLETASTLLADLCDQLETKTTETHAQN